MRNKNAHKNRACLKFIQTRPVLFISNQNILTFSSYTAETAPIQRQGFLPEAARQGIRSAAEADRSSAFRSRTVQTRILPNTEERSLRQIAYVSCRSAEGSRSEGTTAIHRETSDAPG